MQNRHITTGNCSGGDCAPPAGFQSARSWACAHSHASLHPHFASPGLAAQALFGLAKRQLPRTLYAIGFELLEIIDNYRLKMNNIVL